jgi:hypothetical protein
MFTFLSLITRRKPQLTTGPQSPANPAHRAKDNPVINFKNIPHALATFFKAAAKAAEKALPKIESGIEKAEADKQVIEAVADVAANAIAPGSAPAVNVIADAGFAVLGAIDKALKEGGAAAEQKLLDAGLDQAAIDAAKQVGQQSVAVYTAVKAAAK